MSRRYFDRQDDHAVGCALLLGAALCAVLLSLGWLLEHWRR